MDVGEVVVMTEDMVTEVIVVVHPLDAPHHPTITVEDDPGVTTVRDQGLTRRVSASFLLYIFYKQSLVFVEIPDLHKGLVIRPKPPDNELQCYTAVCMSKLNVQKFPKETTLKVMKEK